MCLYSRHYILAVIRPNVGWIIIMERLDIDESSYKKFINYIQS
jgi:hypothetical protein